MPLPEPLSLKHLNLFFQKTIFNQELLTKYLDLYEKPLSDDFSLVIQSTSKQRLSVLDKLV